MNGIIRKAFAIIALAGVAVIASGSSASAQIRAGMFGALNYNTVSADMGAFIPGISGGSNDFSGASGTGAYAGAIGEYAIDDRLGLSLRVSYDQRNFEQTSNGNVLKGKFAYTTIEPGVGIRVGDIPVKFIVGPVMSVKLTSAYSYASASSEPAQDVNNARIGNARQVVFGGRAALGYDIPLNKTNAVAGAYLTPFIEANYLIDQVDPMDPASDASMNTLSGRAGLQVTMAW